MKLVVDNKEFAECMKKILPAVEVSREKKAWKLRREPSV